MQWILCELEKYSVKLRFYHIIYSSYSISAKLTQDHSHSIYYCSSRATDFALHHHMVGWHHDHMHRHAATDREQQFIVSFPSDFLTKQGTSLLYHIAGNLAETSIWASWQKHHQINFCQYFALTSTQPLNICYLAP